MLWRSVRVEMGMYLCIGSMNLCRSFRRLCILPFYYRRKVLDLAVGGSTHPVGTKIYHVIIGSPSGGSWR